MLQPAGFLLIMNKASDERSIPAAFSVAGKNSIPVIAFSAWTGTGKTTIIEQVVKRLKTLGFKVAVIKHDAHDFEIDREGKDSWRFSKAGADITVINSANKTALIEQRSLSLSYILSMIHDVDLVIVEGFNNEDLPQIGISRRATGRGFRLPMDQYIALITDEDTDSHLPVFLPDDSEGITGFIISFTGLL